MEKLFFFCSASAGLGFTALCNEVSVNEGGTVLHVRSSCQ